MTRPPAELLDALIAVLGGAGPDVTLDAWRPDVQGVVGHVVGVRVDGAPAVLKVYAEGADERAATEAMALRLLGEVDGVPVPAVLAHDSALGVPYVIMNRLPGRRLADRRSELPQRARVALHRRVGALLRRMHMITHDRPGALPAGGVTWPDVWSRFRDRVDGVVEDFLRTGGAPAVAAEVERAVGWAEPAFAAADQVVLCHNDAIDGNFLVSDGEAPEITGVVDLERASWDDPMTDLARTRYQASSYDLASADAVVDGYRSLTPDERRRLELHELLHTVEERAWVATDRPQSWRRSVDRLDGLLAARVYARR